MRFSERSEGRSELGARFLQPVHFHRLSLL